MKKVVFCISALSLLFVSSCADKSGYDESDFLGSWVEPIPGMEGVQGVRLEKDGKAGSINMATLSYSSWEYSGDRIILSGKSIGNGITIDFSDTLDVVKFTGDTLLLSKSNTGMQEVRCLTLLPEVPEER